METPPSARLNSLSLAANIPVAITIELTRRCRLSCRHCYLPETRGRAPACPELGTGTWIKILGSLARAGGLYLVFTGGEPLLRPDLPELCAAAAGLGFSVRVFSSGLGMTRRLAGGLAEAGLHGFKISFYGRPPLHDAVTGRRGSFYGSLAAARLLRAAGVAVKMKVPLMNDNIGQAGWLGSLAAREGCAIAFDPVITAANDGARAALKYRLDPAGLRRALRLRPRPQVTPEDPAVGEDPLCGAGRNVCSVGPDGTLYPCLQLPAPLGNLARGSFSRIWKTSVWLKKWRSLRASDAAVCAACADRGYCSRCPGVSMLEEGDVLAPNAPACLMARELRRLRVAP